MDGGLHLVLPQVVHEGFAFSGENADGEEVVDAVAAGRNGESGDGRVGEMLVVGGGDGAAALGGGGEAGRRAERRMAAWSSSSRLLRPRCSWWYFRVWP